jgi:hypothetical protein
MELFAALTRTRSLSQACECYLTYALENSHSYEVLFDGFAKPPSLHEPWPSFNLMRIRLAQRLGSAPRKTTRLMLSLWSLMHGTAMLMIRGGARGPLRTQMVHACLDALEAIVCDAERRRAKPRSGPKWPSGLILGEATRSQVDTEEDENEARTPKGKDKGATLKREARTRRPS